MSDMQTECPTCHQCYQVSPVQLTIAKGMVCCGFCQQKFNAYFCLNFSSPHESVAILTPASHITSDHARLSLNNEIKIRHPDLDIFQRKTETSNIDLRTFLNNNQHLYLHKNNTMMHANTLSTMNHALSSQNTRKKKRMMAILLVA
ncbi:MAG: hypothetical protein QM666_05555, partial [Acinetobacter sp.]